jgi:hypothetical protein
MNEPLGSYIGSFGSWRCTEFHDTWYIIRLLDSTVVPLSPRKALHVPSNCILPWAPCQRLWEIESNPQFSGSSKYNTISALAHVEENRKLNPAQV